jgi:hypothetical protein
MSEKLNQVALVLCHYPAGPSDVNSCCPEPMGQKRCQIKAREVLQTLRNLTEDMIVVGDDRILEHLNNHEIMRANPTPAENCFNAMVDEALK